MKVDIDRYSRDTWKEKNLEKSSLLIRPHIYEYVLGMNCQSMKCHSHFRIDAEEEVKVKVGRWGRPAEE
jgi:hypothetical protein